MVFTSLSERDRQAFFDLLDEYFQSRPELLQSLGGGDGDTGAPATAALPISAARKAFAANPELMAGAASIGRAALRPTAGSHASSPPARSNSDESPEPSLGSVAARAAAFAGSGAPVMPRRTPSTASSSPSPSITDRHTTPHEARGMTQVKRFGDVDTSSAKNMYSTLRNSTANKKVTPVPAAPPIPPAFAPRRDFAPPPTRARVPSPPPTPPPPEEEEAEEEEEAGEEEEGEWAEAIYEYTSEDPGDLHLQEGERVLVVERTSDDWWTGTLEDGQRGLFPASYVKML